MLFTLFFKLPLTQNASLPVHFLNKEDLQNIPQKYNEKASEYYRPH